MTNPSPRPKSAKQAPAAPRPKSTAPHAPNAADAARIVIEIIAAIFLISLAVPWEPATFDQIGPQEYSWMLLVHRAVVTGMQFGRQIVLPEGPLAFLGTDIYEPHTYPILILARTIIALVAFWSLRELGRALIRTPIAALIWLLAAALLMGASSDCFFPDCAFLLLLNYFLAQKRKITASGIAMIVVLGAASLIKTNHLLYSLIAVAAVTIDQAVQRRRRFYLSACAYLGSVALFYVAARQSPRNAGSFLHGWWLVLMGHANGAALPGPIIDALMYLLVTAAAVALIGWSQWKSLRWAGVCPGAAVAAILLLLYKHSFVRQDKWHAIIAPTCALTLLLLYVPAIWRPARVSRRGAGLLVAGFSMVFFWVQSNAFSTPLNYVFSGFEKSGRNILAAGKDIFDPGRLSLQWQASRKEIRDAVDLPRGKIIGGVDAYPHWQCIVSAYDFPFSPRPVGSSYVANTPALASLNARHLASPDAAETILFNFAEVDNKFPTMLDGASIPELLSRYNLIDASTGMLILRRAPVPRRAIFTPLSEQSARFGEDVRVPDVPGTMIWVRIHFKKRATYDLISALYQPPSLVINVVPASGEPQYYALLPDLAGQGFLLSPLMTETPAMADLYRAPNSPLLMHNRVTDFSVTVESAPLGVGLDPEFTVSFQRLRSVPR